MNSFKRVLSLLLVTFVIFGVFSVAPVGGTGRQTLNASADMAFGGESTDAVSGSRSDLTPSEAFLNVISNGDYSGVSPLIIVPGISHSELYLYDGEQPDGIAKNMSGQNIANGTVPIDFAAELLRYIPKLAWELIKVFVTQRSSDSFAAVVREAAGALFSGVESNENGVLKNEDLRLVKFNRQRAEFLQWHEDNPGVAAKEFVSSLSEAEGALPTSYADMYQSDVDRLHRLVTTSYTDAGLKGYEEKVGREKMFFFTFSLYSDASSSAAELEKFIKGVLKITGCEKVSLLNVSLGGTIFTAWAELYGAKNNFKDIDRVVNAVAVLNGTYVAADFFRAMAFNKTERKERYELNPFFNLSDEYLYSGLLKDIAGDMSESNAKNAVTAALLNTVLRLLPRDAVLDLLSNAYSSISDKVFLRSPEIWAMIPKEIYKEVSEKLLSDLPAIKAKTDEFYKAQCSLEKNILTMTKAGVTVNTICGYNFRFGDIDSQFFSLLASSLTKNGDGVINLESSSLGATCALPGEKLPYSSTSIDTKGHSYISPDGSVDASTCVLPNNTWFFKDMLHEDANSNSATTNLIFALSVSEKPFDVLDYPEYYPQFGESANNKKYRRWMIPDAEKLLEESRPKLPAEFVAELEDTIEKARLELQSTRCDAAKVEEIHADFRRLMRDHKRDSTIYQTDSERLTKIAAVFEAADDAVLEFVGGRGFSDFTRSVIRGDDSIKIFAFLKNIQEAIQNEAD
ncbi:MAG: hypothetical protein GX107_01050 [Clostridiales bacterium]|jgi:hypothetical protein|nr:hypothetical protein [Clostridiales bacterium]